MTMTTTAAAVNRTVSENIAVSLLRLGMSRLQLATATGINRSTMYHRMDGVSPWTLAETVAIADYLGLTLAEMTGPLPDFEEWAARVRQQGLEPRTRCLRELAERFTLAA